MTQAPATTIDVLVVDDNPIMRGALRRAVHEVVGGRGWLSPIAASVAVSMSRA
ncbi:hypothetical protein AB0J82_18760 [Asanoa sp. NPDC049518]|uniref:hypothetical protein n=1 Tax=unclassified Asanoa TaxID=2685164 RepID=UPI0034439216